MNLWLRLLLTLLAARWRPRASVFDTTVLPLRALPNDLDVNGHVNNGRYLTLADLARVDFVLRTGTARVALRHRARPIVGDAVAKFRREIGPLRRFDIHTRLLGWDERWTFMEHRFVVDSRVAGSVVIRGLFRAPSGPLSPQVFVDALGIEAPRPRLPDWVRDWSAACDRCSEDLRAEESAAVTAAR